MRMQRDERRSEEELHDSGPDDRAGEIFKARGEEKKRANYREIIWFAKEKM